MNRRQSRNRGNGIATFFLVLVVLGVVFGFIAAATITDPEPRGERVDIIAKLAGDPATPLPSPSPVIVEVTRVVYQVATPTTGPDYEATRAALDIQAAAERAAGDEAYSQAGQIELDRQRSLAVLESDLATATMQAIERDATATLEAVEASIALTQAAAEIAAADLRAVATRAAVGTLAAVSLEASSRELDLELAEIQRETDLRSAENRAIADRYVMPFIPGILAGSLAVAIALIVARIAISDNFIKQAAGLVQAFTGNASPWAPVVEGYLVEEDDEPGEFEPLEEDAELLELLHAARNVNSLSLADLRTTGYQIKNEKWVSMMARLSNAGWIIKTTKGGAVDKWIPRRDGRGKDISIAEIFKAYTNAVRMGARDPIPPNAPPRQAAGLIGN